LTNFLSFSLLWPFDDAACAVSPSRFHFPASALFFAEFFLDDATCRRGRHSSSLDLLNLSPYQMLRVGVRDWRLPLFLLLPVDLGHGQRSTRWSFCCNRSVSFAPSPILHLDKLFFSTSAFFTTSLVQPLCACRSFFFFIFSFFREVDPTFSTPPPCSSF